jgi:hypothetical protein
MPAPAPDIAPPRRAAAATILHVDMILLTPLEIGRGELHRPIIHDAPPGRAAKGDHRAGGGAA